ncbi:MAG TPA: hypothetical protein VI977_03620 [archaeon]|nr:hypothetical protein [archaeon]
MAARKQFKPKSVVGEIYQSQRRLEALGKGGRGKLGGTTKRIKRELHEIGKRSPGYKPVKVHSGIVANFGVTIANTLNRQLRARGRVRGVLVDVGLVKQICLAHDSRRDFPDQDLQAQVTWARRGAPAVARLVGTGESWTLKNYPNWTLEKKILALGDNICRGVKVGNTFANGILLSETAYRLLVSQRQAYPDRVDALTRERQAVIKFERELKAGGVDVKEIIRKMMRRNPHGFEEEVRKATVPNVNAIIKASMKRIGITKF